jgi:RNA polymerase sigma factor (sigma-70 family)
VVPTAHRVASPSTTTTINQRIVRDEHRHRTNADNLYAWRAAIRELNIAKRNNALAPTIRRCQRAVAKAADAFITPNMPWAYKLARTFTGRGGSLTEDYRQAAQLGLVTAAHRWEPGLGSFPTFARTFIRGELFAACRHAEHSLLSKYEFDKRPLVTAAIEDHLAEFHTIPSNHELAFYTDLKVDVVHRIRTAYVVSSDTPIGGDDQFVRDSARTTADNANGSLPEQSIVPTHLDAEQFKQLITAALAQLPAREALALTLHYGLAGNPHLNMVEVGEILGISRETVRKVIDRATARIKPTLGSLIAQIDSYQAA